VAEQRSQLGGEGGAAFLDGPVRVALDPAR
jgi:hypothetical protein